MTIILESRIICGHSRLGAPPAVWFHLDRALLDSLLEGGPDLDAKLAPISLRPPTLGHHRQSGPMHVFADLVIRLLSSAGHRAELAEIIEDAKRPTATLAVEEGITALSAGELIADVLSTEAAPLPDALIDAVAAFRRDAAKRVLNLDARLIQDAAQAAGLPTRWLDQNPFKRFEPGPHTPPVRVGLLQIGQGARRRLVAGSLPDGVSDNLLESLRCRAELMPRLARAGVPIPASDLEFSNRNTATRAVRSAERIGFPVAVKSLYKPRFPHLSDAIDVLGPLHHEDEVRQAFNTLAGTVHRVWVEAWPQGKTYRFLVIGGQVAAISRSDEPSDFRDEVAEDIIQLAEHAAAVCELPTLAGVDICIVDPRGSVDPANCLVTNVLPDPELARHVHDSGGGNVADGLISTLFSNPASARIPMLAVTGTNGKTTTCRMLAQILATEFESVGLATTGGAFVGRECIADGDVAGVSGAAWVLADDRCQAAVLETSRGGLLKMGTAFDHCDIATCLNVRPDHIGYDGIDSLEAMAEVKGRLIERASRAAVLNADDPLCLAMRSRAACDRIILVAESGDQADLRAHREHGGEAVFVEPRPDGDWLVLAHGETQKPLMKLSDIPATMDGLLNSNCFNARFAAATAWASGIRIEGIRRGLAGFSNTVDDSPGRYNFIDGFPFTVLSDYAQNPDGAVRVLQVLDHIGAAGREHLVCMTLGARHRSHIDEVAPLFAERFASITLSGNLTNIELNPEWLSDNPRQTMLDYFRQQLIDAGVSPNQITCCHDEAEAVRIGLNQASDGDVLLVLTPHDVASPVYQAAAEANKD